MRVYILYVARKKKATVFICNRRKFYNFPNISCSVSPLRKTYRPNNRAPFPRRMRDILLGLNNFAQARQSVFGSFCICTVIKAFCFLLALLYSALANFASVFLIKPPFPVKNFQKSRARPSLIFQSLRWDVRSSSSHNCCPRNIFERRKELFIPYALA